MRFLADECVDAALVAALRGGAGHDVQAVQETATAMTDVGVLAIAAEDDRIILTEDKDFGDLTFRQRIAAVPGIVLPRIAPSARHSKWPRLAAAVDRFGDRLAGHYTVVGRNRLRTRPLPAIHGEQ